MGSAYPKSSLDFLLEFCDKDVFCQSKKIKEIILLAMLTRSSTMCIGHKHYPIHSAANARVCSWSSVPGMDELSHVHGTRPPTEELESIKWPTSPSLPCVLPLKAFPPQTEQCGKDRWMLSKGNHLQALLVQSDENNSCIRKSLSKVLTWHLIWPHNSVRSNAAVVTDADFSRVIPCLCRGL